MNKMMMKEDAVRVIASGNTVMVGGFLQGGSPETLLSALLETDADGLEVISNDTGTAYTNMIKLMQQGRVRSVIASYIGANPETERMLLVNPESVELCPQGTLAERIRAGGAGIPAFLTPVGVNTVVEKGKQKMVVGGKECLMEMALHADVALIYATKVDCFGNCFMRGTTKNFNALMATAAEYVIVEAEEVIASPLDSELITVSGIYIDAVIKVGK